MPSTPDAEHAAWEGRERTGPLQIGFGREIPAAYQDDLAPRLEWTTLSDGSVVSALSVTSPGARALRVAVYASLGPGGELRFFSPGDLGQGFDPLTEQDFPLQASESAAVDDPLPPDPPLWSPVIEGETVGIEITLPSSQSLSTFSLYVDQVSHLVSSAHQYESLRLSEVGNATCSHVDVQCRDVDPQASATAKMIYNDENGDVFGCTGTLLRDSDNTTDIPYFLTAHHCISTQAVADTLVTYWDFERVPCGGPDPAEVIGLGDPDMATQGAELLETDQDSDSALLKLKRSPPSENGRWYMGWDSTPLSHPTAVYGVHHPAGDLKKYSEGITYRDLPFELEGGQWVVDGLYVVWSRGTIEKGSSGSGLFDLDGRLRGVASGGFGECPTGTAYGRFDQFFPLVSNYLGSDGETPDGETPDGETPDGETPDDAHGDTLEQATGVKPNSAIPAILGRRHADEDVDYFRVSVDQAGTLTVETMGGTDTVGYLRGDDGQELGYDDDRGLGLNFRIVQSVSAGTYYIQVNGFESAPGEVTTGPYTLVVRFTPTRTDDHGNTYEKAGPVKPTSSTPGVLERQGDVDYFRVLVSEMGTLTVETTGDTDTVGHLRGAEGQWLSEDDDGGSRLNFRLVESVSAGTYYIRVSGFDNATGRYTLKVQIK